jgi:hypothetical protein
MQNFEVFSVPFWVVPVAPNTMRCIVLYHTRHSMDVYVRAFPYQSGGHWASSIKWLGIPERAEDGVLLVVWTPRITSP